MAKQIRLQDQVILAKTLDDMASKGFGEDFSGERGGDGKWQEEIPAAMNNQILKSLFYTEDWVFIIVDLCANKLSSQPLVIKRRKMVDGKESSEPAPEHPLNELIEQPNPWQDYTAWMYNTIVEDVLMGNQIIWHAPRNGHLITLPADNVNITFNAKRELDKYQLTSGSDDSGFANAKQVLMALDAKDVIHVRRPNPNSLLWGLSPFVPGGKSTLFNRYSTDYINSFYLKQALPGLALSMDRQVNEDVAIRQLRAFETAYTGRRNMRRTLILPKGVKAEALTHTLADQKLIEMIGLNRETMMGLLKVPKHELSLQEAGSLGSEEHKIALRNFWESTLIPIAKRIEGAMNKFFAKELGGEYFFEFDLSDVPALKDDMLKKAETAKAMLAAGLSVNEVRVQVWDQPEYDADDAIKPFVLVSQNQSPFAAAPAPQQAQDQTLALPAKAKFDTGRFDMWRKTVVKQLDEDAANKISLMADRTIDLLTGITSLALDILEESSQEPETKMTLLDDRGNKITVGSRKADLPSNREIERRLKRAIEDQFEEDWIVGTTRTLSSSVDLGYDQQLELVFNNPALTEIEALRARDAESRRLTLASRGLDSFAQISKTHTERIMREIQKSVADNDPIGKTISRVAASLGDVANLLKRAETIARTETLTAVSIGQAAAVANAAEVIPGLKKGWLTAGDNRVRDSHEGLDGDVIAVDETFDNGLRHPRDTQSNEAAEVINCRCTLVLIPPNEDLVL